jgi:hypothetical protein
MALPNENDKRSLLARPPLIEMNYRELEKKFGRTQ